MKHTITRIALCAVLAVVAAPIGAGAAQAPKTASTTASASKTPAATTQKVAMKKTAARKHRRWALLHRKGAKKQGAAVKTAPKKTTS